MMQDSILFTKKCRANCLKPLTITGTGMGKTIKMFSIYIANYNLSLSKIHLKALNTTNKNQT